MPKFKLKYDNLENIKADRVNTVVFNLPEIRQLKFFFGTPGIFQKVILNGWDIQFLGKDRSKDMAKT